MNYFELVGRAYKMGIADKLEEAYQLFTLLASSFSDVLSPEELASLLAGELRTMQWVESDFDLGPDYDDDAAMDAELERQAERHYYQYVVSGDDY